MSNYREEAERMSVIADIVRQNRDILPEELCSFTDIPYSKMAEYIGKMVCDGIIVTDSPAEVFRESGNPVNRFTFITAFPIFAEFDGEDNDGKIHRHARTHIR